MIRSLVTELFCGKILTTINTGIKSESELQTFITRHGIKHFKAREILRPPKLGGVELLPGSSEVHKCIPILLLAEEMRREAGSPIKVAWWWRPEDINKQVGGAKNSDHLYSDAMDFDFTDEESLMRALRGFVAPIYRTGRFCLSVGIGATRLHLGCGSIKGNRHWYYPTHRKEAEELFE